MKNVDTCFLVKALKKDDLRALEKLYKLYYSKLYNFSRKYDSGCLKPDDFVQQTFLKVWENREQLKEDVLFDKQIFIICRNLILNQLRKDNRLDSMNGENEIHETVEENFQGRRKMNLEKLNSILLLLPKKRKEIFLLHKVENLTYEEIAQFSGISKKTIANHIYLASSFIKKELQKI